MKPAKHLRAKERDTKGAMADFLCSTLITQLVDEDNDSKVLHRHLNAVIAENASLQSVIITPPTVIHMPSDEHSSARALMFGVLIAASARGGDLGNTPGQALRILLTTAFKLKFNYEQGLSDLAGLSGAFLLWGNAIIHIIQAIQTNEISTCELVFLANKDDGKQSLGQALVDLSHYILYEKINLFINNDRSSHDERQIFSTFFAEYDNECVKMSDILNGKKRYSHSVRTLICNYLNISCQLLSIGSNLSVNLNREGLCDNPIEFTMVSVNNHTHLMQDVTILTQMNTERNGLSLTAIGDPELRFRQKVISFDYHFSPKQLYLENKQLFIEYRNMAGKQIEFPVFSSMCRKLFDLFINNIRPEIWRVEMRDTLGKLEKTFCRWHTEMCNLPSTPDLDNNKALILDFLFMISNNVGIPPLPEGSIFYEERIDMHYAAHPPRLNQPSQQASFPHHPHFFVSVNQSISIKLSSRSCKNKALSPLQRSLEELRESLNIVVLKMKRDKQQECQEAFVSFEEHLLRMMDQYSDQKMAIVQAAKHVTEAALKDAEQSTPFFLHLLQMHNYFELLLKRIKNPMPFSNELEKSDEENYLEMLKAEYFPEKMRKFNFLVQFEDKIRENPQKTYTDCFLEVRNRTPANQALFSSSHMLSHRFFRQSRFHYFIERLLKFDVLPEERWFDEAPPKASCI